MTVFQVGQVESPEPTARYEQRCVPATSIVTIFVDLMERKKCPSMVYQIGRSVVTCAIDVGNQASLSIFVPMGTTRQRGQLDCEAHASSLVIIYILYRTCLCTK